MFIFFAARQITFSIKSDAESVGTMEKFDWGGIAANDLKKPPSGARNLSSVIDSNVFSLFADGEKPFRIAHECIASNCSTNCPDSESDAVISRRRRALLCLKGTTTQRRLQFTCSVPCPAWQPARPRIVWLANGKKVLRTLQINKSLYRECENIIVKPIYCNLDSSLFHVKLHIVVQWKWTATSVLYKMANHF